MTDSGANNRISGFTYLEVLVVLIVIGIVSVVIIGRSDTDRADLLTQTEVIKSHIRYTQSRSMNTERAWGFQGHASGTSYWLFVDGDPVNNKRRLPGEDADTVNLAAFNLTLLPPSVTLSFDGRGRPCSDAAASILRGSDLVLTLTADNGATTTITVTRNTGFVP